MLSAYLPAFTTVSKKASSTVYLDLFAGQTGRPQSITDNFRDRIAEATERADERIGPGLSRPQCSRRSLTHGPAA